MLRLLKIGVLFLCAEVVFAGADNSHICPSGISTEELVQVFDTAAFVDEESALVFDKPMWRSFAGSIRYIGSGKKPKDYFLLKGYNYSVAGAALYANLNRDAESIHVVHAGNIFRKGDFHESNNMKSIVKRHSELFVKNSSEGYACSYWTDRSQNNGKTYYTLYTNHRLPLAGILTENDHVVARACVTHSFLSYLGYRNVEAVSNDLLVTPRKKDISLFNQYKIFNFLSSLSVELKEEFSSPVHRADAVQIVSNYLNKECK